MADPRGWAPLIAMQSEYSLVERTPERDLIPGCAAVAGAVRDRLGVSTSSSLPSTACRRRRAISCHWTTTTGTPRSTRFCSRRSGWPRAFAEHSRAGLGRDRPHQVDPGPVSQTASPGRTTRPNFKQAGEFAPQRRFVPGSYPYATCACANRSPLGVTARCGADLPRFPPRGWLKVDGAAHRKALSSAVLLRRWRLGRSSSHAEARRIGRGSIARPDWSWCFQCPGHS
jgi:hypothetical protein